MRKYNLIIRLLVLVTLFNVFSLNCFAYDLPSGSVQGLPDRLVVLDDSGKSVSDNGDYYFEVKDMEANVTYTKDIEIINLREDASYRITFGAERVSNKGEINLEKECECIIKLDNQEIYKGKITGEGTQNISVNPLDMGVFAPGDARKLSVSIEWNGTSAGGFIDNGQKVVSAGGTQITRDFQGKTVIQGVAEFKWSFRAEVVDVDTDTSTETESKVYSMMESTVELTSSESDSEETNDTASASSSSTSSAAESKVTTTIAEFVKTGEAVAVIFLMAIMVATLALMLSLSKRKKDS